MKIIQRAGFEYVKVGVDTVKSKARYAIIEINGTRFYSVSPHDETHRDIINGALDVLFENAISGGCSRE